MELPEEDRPPEQIWLDDEAIAEHMERIREERRAKYSNGSNWEPVVDRPMEDNEIAASWRKQLERR